MIAGDFVGILFFSKLNFSFIVIRKVLLNFIYVVDFREITSDSVK